MKTIFLLNKIFLVLFLALGFSVSCSDDDEPVVEKGISVVDKTPIAIGFDAGTKTIEFTAAGDWTASLSTTSWIKIDKTTNSGVKGSASVTLNWDEKASANIREANLTILVNGEEPFVIKITQMGVESELLIDKSELDLVLDSNIGANGEFRDAIVVTSNVKWVIKDKPDWINIQSEGGKDPIDGPSVIRLFISANHDSKAFNSQNMTGSLVIGLQDDTSVDKTITAKSSNDFNIFESYSNNAIKTVELDITGEDGPFAGIDIKGNARWELVRPVADWLSIDEIYSNNNVEYNKSIDNEKTISLGVYKEKYDTKKKETTIAFRNKLTGQERSINVIFPGMGDDYIKLKFPTLVDFKFNASATTWDGNPIVKPVLDCDFLLTSSVNYTSMADCPLQFYCLKASNEWGPIFKEKVDWASIDMSNTPSSRGALTTKDFVLTLEDRNVNTDAEVINPENGYVTFDKSFTRFFTLVVVNSTVNYDDMFDEVGELKSEYRDNSRSFKQAGVFVPDFAPALSKEIQFANAAEVKTFEFTKTPSYISYVLLKDGKETEIEGHDWILIKDGYIDGIEDRLKNISFDISENNGEARQETIRIKSFNSSDDKSYNVCDIVIRQSGVQ